MIFNNGQIAAILAGLECLEREMRAGFVIDSIEEILTDGGQLEMMTHIETSDLIKAINCDTTILLQVTVEDVNAVCDEIARARLNETDASQIADQVIHHMGEMVGDEIVYQLQVLEAEKAHQLKYSKEDRWK
jgi:hypothetical protein